MPRLIPERDKNQLKVPGGSRLHVLPDPGPSPTSPKNQNQDGVAKQQHVAPRAKRKPTKLSFPTTARHAFPAGPSFWNEQDRTKGKGRHKTTQPISRHGRPRHYLFMVDRSSAVCSSGRSLRSSFASTKVNHWRSRFSRSGQSASSLVTVTS